MMPELPGGSEQTLTGGEPSVSTDLGLDFLRSTLLPIEHGRLAQYDIRRVLGHGAYGIVLEAFDEKLRRPVALKILKPELANNPTARKRFIREARAAGAIRHLNVVGVYR
jgi:serine/threonine protein kinase